MFRLLLGLQAGLLLLGLAVMTLAHYPWVQTPDPLRDSVAFGVVYLGLMLLERVFAWLFPRSFAATEALHRALGYAMQRQSLSYPHALALAGASGVAEEVFFRGALQNLLGGGVLGLVLQAVVFAALHPPPNRQAWAYPLFTLVAGLWFGLAYMLTGSLIPGILAHFLHNARGFYQLLDEHQQANT